MPGICGRCGRNVYAAEERLGLNKSWHIRCFTCAICNRTLDSFTLAENRELDEIYCKVCYRKKFATKGYGYGPNEPTLVSSLSGLTPKDKKCRTSKSPLIVSDVSVEKVQQQKLKCSCSKSEENIPIVKGVTSAKITSMARKSKKSTLKWPESKTDINPCWMSSVHVEKEADIRKAEMKTASNTCIHCRVPLPRYRKKQHENSVMKICGPQKISSSRPALALKASDNSTHQSVKAIKRLGGGEPCKRCQRPVYWAEMKLGRSGAYHQECFCCCSCGKALESTTVSENGGEIFCKGCYRRFFATHGCGYGLGAGTLQTP